MMFEKEMYWAGTPYLSVREHCCNKKQYADQEAHLYPEIRAIDPVYTKISVLTLSNLHHISSFGGFTDRFTVIDNKSTGEKN